jgi:hypothetical protein
LAFRVVLVGRPACHLCDDAREVVEAVCADLAVPWEERSIDDDEGLHERYWDLIPVTLVDGREVGVFRIEPDVLRAALRLPYPAGPASMPEPS